MPYKDPIKQKEAQRKHYVNNKEKYLESSRRNRPIKNRQRGLWVQEIKSQLGCKICGENRIPCLDFHHRDPSEKDADIGYAVWNWSKKRVLEEIAKCDVLCRNCHSWLHYEENIQEIDVCT